MHEPVSLDHVSSAEMDSGATPKQAQGVLLPTVLKHSCKSESIRLIGYVSTGSMLPRYSVQ